MARLRKYLLSPVGDNGVGFYHCLSRVVDRNFVFGEAEREVFRKTMRQVEAFSGVRVITWTILSNHFHLLLAVPPRPEVEPSDAEILEELGLPDPDTLDEGDDFSRFMGGAIPTRLRNRALRRLWLTNPVLANLDELVDYGEDFTDAATVVENLQTAYRVGKGFLRREEIEAVEGAEEGDSDEVVEGETDDPEVDLAADEAAFPPDGSEPDAESIADATVAEGSLQDFEAEPDPRKALETSHIARPRRMVFRSA